jgi:uncharacterized protein with von Willebrand factor type A (vWA) domain
VLAGLEDLAPGAPSDYGRALWTLLEHARGFRGRTVLWIVGDARTNRFDPYAFALEELRGRVDRVVWFVPEPRARWCTGDSALAAYAPHVHAVYEASTLIALAEAVRDAIAHL